MEKLQKDFEEACDDQETGSLRNPEVNTLHVLISASFPSLEKEKLAELWKTHPWEGKSSFTWLDMQNLCKALHLVSDEETIAPTAEDEKAEESRQSCMVSDSFETKKPGTWFQE